MEPVVGVSGAMRRCELGEVCVGVAVGVTTVAAGVRGSSLPQSAAMAIVFHVDPRVALEENSLAPRLCECQ